LRREEKEKKTSNNDKKKYITSKWEWNSIKMYNCTTKRQAKSP
jgi:hypothetical protein